MHEHYRWIWFAVLGLSFSLLGIALTAQEVLGSLGVRWDVLLPAGGPRRTAGGGISGDRRSPPSRPLIAAMRTLIVYESYFGCTQDIAEALAAEFGGAGPTILTPVETARHHAVGAYDLVVAGGPTQGHGLSRPGTRREVLTRAAMRHRPPRVDPRISIGLREWLDGLGLCAGIAAAAFDTRLNGPALLTGRASRTLAAELRHHGFRLISDPVSFLVGPDDRLLPEEDARAAAWASDLIRSMESRDQMRGIRQPVLTASPPCERMARTMADPDVEPAAGTADPIHGPRGGCSSSSGPSPSEWPRAPCWVRSV